MISVKQSVDASWSSRDKDLRLAYRYVHLFPAQVGSIVRIVRSSK